MKPKDWQELLRGLFWVLSGIAFATSLMGLASYLEPLPAPDQANADARACCAAAFAAQKRINVLEAQLKEEGLTPTSCDYAEIAKDPK